MHVFNSSSCKCEGKSLLKKLLEKEKMLVTTFSTLSNKFNHLNHVKIVVCKCKCLIFSPYIKTKNTGATKSTDLRNPTVRAFTFLSVTKQQNFRLLTKSIC